LEAGPFSQVLYPKWPPLDSVLPTLFPSGAEIEPLDPSLIWHAHRPVAGRPAALHTWRFPERIHWRSSQHAI